jgi:hypothetical protein
VLDGVHWWVLCSTEVRESAVAATEVAADDDAGVTLNAVVGYDPSYVLAADVPSCSPAAWHLAVHAGPEDKTSALQSAQALCEATVEQHPEWNCDHGGSATWFDDDVQQFAYFDHYVAAVEADDSTREFVDRSDPLTAATIDFTRYLGPSCTLWGCEVRGALRHRDADHAEVHLVLLQQQPDAAEQSATSYVLTLDHGAAGATLWWMASLEQAATVTGSDVASALKCCEDVLTTINPSGTGTTQP